MSNIIITTTGCTCCKKACAGFNIIPKTVESCYFGTGFPQAVPDPANLLPWQSANYTGGDFNQITAYLGCINWASYTSVSNGDEQGITANTPAANASIAIPDGMGGCQLQSTELPYIRFQENETWSYTITTTTDLATGQCTTTVTGTRNRTRTTYEKPFVNADLNACSNSFEGYNDPSRIETLTSTAVMNNGIPVWSNNLTVQEFDYDLTTDPQTGITTRTLTNTTTTNTSNVEGFALTKSHWSDFSGATTSSGTGVYTAGVDKWQYATDGVWQLDIVSNSPDPVPQIATEAYSDVARTDTYFNPYHGVWCVRANPQPYLEVRWRGIQISTVDNLEEDWGGGVITNNDLIKESESPLGGFESSPIVGVPNALGCHETIETIYRCQKDSNDIIISRH